MIDTLAFGDRVRIKPVAEVDAALHHRTGRCLGASIHPGKLIIALEPRAGDDGYKKRALIEPEHLEEIEKTK